MCLLRPSVQVEVPTPGRAPAPSLLERVTGDVAPPIIVGQGVNGIAVGQGGVWVTIDR